jgi:hypothetical protein
MNNLSPQLQHSIIVLALDGNNINGLFYLVGAVCVGNKGSKRLQQKQFFESDLYRT